ncbi:hypothetical protein Q4E93_01170 [Flavitalea sp. BT771]|uniref:hypothetical protein n=1 Tax=Flavitalea sp. BT771 TaxID=3063329 RepID=UPI0026E1E774|nr:hypothetical protein [Flavitalea sp. BT771]MDO6429177.1 hypothetical protein [Flavitalea sp. BT771]MDV6218695.1 hypothetical protein [Flavitalea sp. BT771]
MTDRPDIWNHLKDHEVLPPQEVFDRLQDALENEEGHPLSAPGPEVSPLMERLQQHEVPPPPFLRQHIEEGSGIRPSRSGAIRWYLSAAACLLLIVSGWIIYRSNRGPLRTAAREKTLPPPASSAVAPLHTDTLSGKTDTSTGTAAMTANVVTPAGSGKNGRLTYSIGGRSVAVTDNDLFATFISYTYPDIPGYLTRDADKPLSIYVDQYTSITVSKNMLEMMKQTYQVLPDGRPARKARKAKRRLESWKEKDQKRFDKGAGVNPLDPVDLGDFIFK